MLSKNYKGEMPEPRSNKSCSFWRMNQGWITYKHMQRWLIIPRDECLWVFGIRLNVPSVFAMDSPNQFRVFYTYGSSRHHLIGLVCNPQYLRLVGFK